MSAFAAAAVEEARLEALLGFHILDTPPEPEFDDLARAAALIAETPMAVISLVDRDRLWFKARVGVPQTEVPRAGSFCDESIRNPPLFEIQDALAEARFRDNPLVAAGARFYAGAPITVAGRRVIGCLSVLDVKPRRLTPAQRDSLVILARAAAAQLELQSEVKSRQRRDRIMLSLLGDLKEGQQKLQEANATLERRVAERTAQIQGTLQELEGFAFNIAHNLRAPLRSMNGYSRTLLSEHAGGLDETAREFLGRIAASCVTLDDMISDLLAYYHLPCGTFPREAVELAGLVEKVIREMEPEIRGRRAHVGVEPGLPKVVGNEGLLGQALAQLLSNAVKFTAPGQPPVVNVKAERLDGWIRVWVEDNGIGIAPEQRERIYQVFERLHGAEEYPGTGIGLAITRKAVELMGGRTGFESRAGSGSRFWIDLRPAER
jgi:signal transduction histidine kinase